MIWFTPSLASHIHGVAIGPIGSVHICNRDSRQTSNGINIEFIGTGLLSLLGSGQIVRGYYEEGSQQHEEEFIVTHNGAMISVLGTYTPRISGIQINGVASVNSRVNGISINGIMSMIEDQRGVSISMFNFSKITKGLQIGLFNRSAELHGLQLGLWNRDQFRSLPILNWGIPRPAEAVGRTEK